MTKQTKTVKDDTQIKKSKVCDVFTLVKNEAGKVLIVVGDQIVANKVFETFKDAEQYLGTKPYEVIFNCCLVMINLYKNGQLANDNKETDKVSEDSK